MSGESRQRKIDWAKRSHRLFILVMVVSLLLFGVASASEGVHWSYEGNTGPAYWGVLSPDYALCASGQSQSPIDIPPSAATNPADLGLTYNPSALNIFNNGHTIQVNYDPGSALKIDGDTYELVQYHFHAASEHTVSGKQRPMELHLVHKNAKNQLAVVGVFLEQGVENAAYAPIFNNLPAKEGEPHAVPGVKVDGDDLLPAVKTYWRYNGSLTTPPCTEGVKWLVMNTPVAVSAGQIGKYTAIYPNNARPVQPLGNRQFIVGQAPGLPTTGADLSNPVPIALITSSGLMLVVAGAYILRRRRVV